ncbi:hypothetical protein [Desulfotomaculum defluvii]
MNQPMKALGFKIFLLWCILLLPGIVGVINGSGLSNLQDNYWGQLIPWGKTQTIEAIALIIILTVAFFLYVKAIKVSKRASLFEVTAWTLLFTVIFILLFPFACEDVYYYIASGQLQYTYQENPYLKTPHQIIGWQEDPFLSTTGWGFLLNPYGPLWNMVTALLVSLAAERLWLALLILKVFAGILHMINLFLIGYAAKELNLKPTQAMVVYGWNPLLLFELPGHAHNDVLLLTFLILAFICLATTRATFVLPLLTISAMVKYTSVLLGPPIALWLILKKKYLSLVVSTTLLILLVLLVWAPYWEGIETLAGLFRQMNFYSIKSLHYLLFMGLSQWFANIPNTQAFQISSRIFLGIFGVLYAYMLYHLWSKREPASISGLVKLCIVIFILYLFLINKWFQPWYFCWFIPLLALCKETSPIFPTALLLSYTAELSRVPQLIIQNTGPLVQVLSVTITWLPLLGYILCKNIFPDNSGK